jgi:hypothetical protein
VALTLMLIQAACAFPATAHDGVGPAFFCDPRAFENCTDTSDPALAEDAFNCEGTVNDAASCTNQRGESSPYCVFVGEESGKNRDAYLCGPTPGFADKRLVDKFWQQVEAAQRQVGYP